MAHFQETLSMDSEAYKVSGDNAHLEGQTSETKMKVASRKSQRRKLDVQLDKEIGIGSAARRMPAEILGQMFLAYPYDTTDRLRSLYRNGHLIDEALMARIAREELIQLMLVCRAWRNPALTTHRLWSAVLIDHIDAQGLSFNKAASWLRRAGNMPRKLGVNTLYFHDCPRQGHGNPTSTSTFPCILNNPPLARLLLEGPPVHTLYLKITHQRCLKNFAKQLSSRTEGSGRRGSIKSTHLTARWKRSDSFDTYLSCCPSLTDIRLHCWLDVSALTVGCLQRLTSLTFYFTGVSPNDTLTALSKCERLEELNLTFHTESSPLETSLVVCLPKLKVFRAEVKLGEPAQCIHILKHLHFPVLVTLDITYARHPSTAPVWRHFFQRHPGIRVFKCRGANGAPLQAAFNHLPSLTLLSIEGDTTAIAWLISRLRRSLIQKEFWLPRLEHLELLGVEDQIDLQCRFDFLLSRSHGHDKEPQDVVEVVEISVGQVKD